MRTLKLTQNVLFCSVEKKYIIPFTYLSHVIRSYFTLRRQVGDTKEYNKSLQGSGETEDNIGALKRPFESDGGPRISIMNFLYHENYVISCSLSNVIVIHHMWLRNYCDIKLGFSEVHVFVH